jgi:uncharacterized repeat protein (TIGR03803 family)
VTRGHGPHRPANQRGKEISRAILGLTWHSHALRLRRPSRGAKRIAAEQAFQFKKGRMMFRVLDIAAKFILGTMFTVALIGHFSPAQAVSFKVLHSFSGGSDGCYPAAGLIRDGTGKLYGTTAGGNGCNCGTVFELVPAGSETVLYNFTCGDNGQAPDDTLAMDKKGNLYGATIAGGSIGCGVIFKVTPSGREKTVHDFAGPPSDGCAAQGTLIFDGAANLYGTTSGGGKNGYGTVFELSPDGTETVLYSFCKKIPRCTDGAYPLAGLTADPAGDVYGATGYRGSRTNSGTIFELAPDGAETTLYKFKGSPNDGSLPEGSIIEDNSGNFYGTLFVGGRGGCYGDQGCGVVFKLAPGGAETILHFFTGKKGDGANPFGSLLADGAGNMFGATEFGGGRNVCNGSYGCGMVFELAADGTETVLHTFGKGNNGANPSGNLVADNARNLYGAAAQGGVYGFGTIFEITP